MMTESARCVEAIEATRLEIELLELRFAMEVETWHLARNFELANAESGGKTTRVSINKDNYMKAFHTYEAAKRNLQSRGSRK